MMMSDPKKKTRAHKTGMRNPTSIIGTASDLLMVTARTTSQDTDAGRQRDMTLSHEGMDTRGHSTPDSTNVGKIREMPVYGEKRRLTIQRPNC